MCPLYPILYLKVTLHILFALVKCNVIFLWKYTSMSACMAFSDCWMFPFLLKALFLFIFLFYWLLLIPDYAKDLLLCKCQSLFLSTVYYNALLMSNCKLNQFVYVYFALCISIWFDGINLQGIESRSLVSDRHWFILLYINGVKVW